jgi:hypothetical protein
MLFHCVRAEPNLGSLGDGSARACIHDEWVSAERRYFSEGSMAKLYAERDNDDATVGQLEPSD